MFSPPHPEAVGSYGDMAAEWIEARMAADPNAEGDGLLWHQWLILQRSLEHRADGSLCWPLVLCEMPRQQGKTVLLAELALWRSGNPGLFGEVQRVLHGARVASLADQVQGLAHMWAEDNGLKVSRRKADSYITWPDGSYWHVMALAAVWGQRVGLALLDEGWDMSPAAFWSALWPAMAQRKKRQAWIFSASNEADRGLMASLRKIAQTLIIFWGAPAGADVTDEAVWWAATPHMTSERLEGMRIASSAPGFAVDWLNVAPDPDDDDADVLQIPAAQWDGLRSPLAGDVGAVGVEAAGSLPPVVVSAGQGPDGRVWVAARRAGSVRDAIGICRTGRPLSAPLLVGKSLLTDPGWRELGAVPMTGSVGDAAAGLWRLLGDGLLAHDGSEVLAEQVVGLQAVQGPGGLRVTSRGPLDAVKAMVWAVDAARDAPVPFRIRVKAGAR